MLNKIPNFQTHIFFFLFLSICSGGVFAFVFDHYWATEYFDKTTVRYDFNNHLFYLYCILSYLLQAIGYGLVSEHPDRALYKTGIGLFWGQFVLSLLWLGLFFGVHRYGYALFNLFIAFYMFLFTYNTFKQLDLRASYLLIPQGVLFVLVGSMNIFILLY